MIEREKRYPIVIPARIRWNGRWVAASIRDISTKGVMLRAESPPSPGTYVEIQLASGVLVGRAIWCQDRSCGLRLQSRLDVAALLGTRGDTDAVATDAATASASPRLRTERARLRAKAERSRQIGSIMQFAIVAVVGVSAAGTIGWEVYKTLSVPMAAIGRQV